jgi:hypothetical protein
MREAMPIRALLNDDQSFSPEEAKVLVEVFEQSLKALRLVDREDPATLLVAEKVLEAARGGERDTPRLRTWVLLNSGRHRHSCWETMLSGIVQDAGGCLPASSSRAPVKVRNPGGHTTPRRRSRSPLPGSGLPPWRVKRSRANAD